VTAHKSIMLQRSESASQSQSRRPVMLAIAGDSAAGKTTLTRGIAAALGPDRATAICVDDYHRYDRAERGNLDFSVLNPECNYIEVMEQHLQLLALGRPVLKPVYDHSTGELTRPVLVEPREFVLVEGLLPLHSKLARACFDITVYLDPPEEIRRSWKLRRDCADRGYSRDQVLRELDRREPDSAAYIRPQRQWADICVRFAPIEGRRAGAAGLSRAGLSQAESRQPEPLSAELLLRPTVQHPDLSGVLTDDDRRTVHLKLIRDADGRPVDALHIHGYAPREDARIVEKAIWEQLTADHGTAMPETLGSGVDGGRSEPLAIAQLLLVWHLLEALD
jgi:phosphoribulokinase